MGNRADRTVGRTAAILLAALMLPVGAQASETTVAYLGA